MAVKKIGVLTSGGDAPGMNAAIRAVVRYSIYKNIEVVGIEQGYTGLISNNIFPMHRRSVSDIIHRGGTILRTARCPKFNTPEGVKLAAEVMDKNGIDGLIVIGGDGTFRGAKDLSVNYGKLTVGIPGTIDNDLAYTDFSIGFDTAVNTVLSAINNLRDTMTSHDRACIVEVMGRNCGDIALYSGLCGGAENILVPEMPFDLDKIAAGIKENTKKGKLSDIIILAEGAAKAEDLKEKLEKECKIQIIISRLGHIQRGGAPTMFDRALAARLALRAVDLLAKDKGNRVVGIKNNKIIDIDISEAVSMKKVIDDDLFEAARILSL
ncbi:MAG: 6-phosphofructokinase [Firmicutes bacterium]|nr:6-phosphofructokinase [Bacillota bacterium]